MIARFCRYAEKIFGLGHLTAGLRDGRTRPQIPTAAIFNSALLMFAMRLGSLNALESQMRPGGRWASLTGRRTLSADSVGRVVGRMSVQDLRGLLGQLLRRMRRNKILQDNPWPLRFVALDAHEFFSLHPALLPPMPSA